MWFLAQDMVQIVATVPENYPGPKPLVPVVNSGARADCILPGMDCKIVILSRFVAVRLANPKSITISDGGGGSCGYADVVALIADHADWPAPGWYSGVVTRDSAMTSPAQCQVLCLQTDGCDFFSCKPHASGVFVGNIAHAAVLLSTDEWEYTNGDYYHECYLKARDPCRDGQPDEYVEWASEDPAWNGASGPKICEPPAPPPVTYAFTSFEEPIAPVCPGLSQGNCDRTFDGTGADCATATGCPIPNGGVSAACDRLGSDRCRLLRPTLLRTDRCSQQLPGIGRRGHGGRLSALHHAVHCRHERGR